MALEAISVPPATGNPPNQLFVALHGWGSNAQDLASLAPMLNLGNCQMVFPHAPFPHPHVPGGKMWYNLEQWDEQGLAESRQRLTEWHFPLAVLCSLSGYLHGQPQAGQTFPPVLIVHGRQDSIVPLKAAQQARDALTSLGVAVEYQEFDMQHEVQPAVLDLMQRFITTKM
ncbi:MAG: serine esterase [Cyanobacteria bacterium SW_8_48_13]|nr:MAG: serine esterase [Cyanobacteria bacterium SW_8_48_13]